MRRTLRLLANVKPTTTTTTTTTARYLEAGNPTGLTGVFTHGSPRSSLLFLYSRTLEQLQRFPESSVYRQSVEALTKHRLAIVEAAEPPGFAAWQERAQKILDANPDEFTIASKEAVGQRRLDGASAVLVASGQSVFVRRSDPQPADSRFDEWDGEPDEGAGAEGLRGQDERDGHYAETFERQALEASKKVDWEPEPQLTADQIEEIENKVGAGLIEEVILMAKSELKLIDILYKAKVWEPLGEKPAEGQWTYFERNSS